MTANALAAIAGIILSLALAYLPGLAPRWNALPGDHKRAILGLLLVLTAAGSLAATCLPATAALLPPNWAACTTESLGAGLEALIYALVANQGMYQLAVEGRLQRRPA